MSRLEAEARLVRILRQRLKLDAGTLRWIIRYMALVEESRSGLVHTSVNLPPEDKARLELYARQLSEPGYQVSATAIMRAALHLVLNELETLIVEAENGELEASAERVIAGAGKLHPETQRRLRKTFRGG